MDSVGGAIDGAADSARAWWEWLRDGVTSVFDGATADPTRPATTPTPTPAPAAAMPPARLVVAGAVVVAGLFLLTRGR